MQEEIAELVKKSVQELFGIAAEPHFTRPDEQFGDFATNVALQLAKQVGKAPREVAEAIAGKLEGSADIARVEVAGPGFINVTMVDQPLITELATILKRGDDYGRTTAQAGKVVVAEYSDPNPFKVLHVGHLYDSIIGESIALLCEAAGATVHRVNFGGDVGLHVGKTMWAILKRLGGENPDKLADIAAAERSNWMAEAYVEGSQAYADDEAAKLAIIALNKRVYEIQANSDHDSPLARIYWTCRQWSYDYFNEFYERIGTKFEKYYPESLTAPYGVKAVNEELAKGVFEKSDGAVVFKGEPHGLHTRVFMNSAGLPTYETKDIGLALAKWEDYHFDRTIIITGNEISEYMKVVLKALEQFVPEIPARTTHFPHGMVKLQGGVKMSSRKGNFIRANDILDAAAAANQAANNKDDERVTLGAVKYAFLKQRIGPDVIYDPLESVSLQGNSGPYLQYAHARARSILSKAGDELSGEAPHDLEPEERSLLRRLSEYPEVVERAIDELMPHLIATYLYELAQAFNRFYEKNRVVGDPRQALRLQLVAAYAQILKNGLSLLGIAAPERM